MRDFGSHVDQLTNVDLASEGTTKNDLLLNIRLPKYGTYVDIADLLDLTAKTSVVRSLLSPRERAVTVTDLPLGSRVPSKRLHAAVDKLSFVDIDRKASEGEFVHLNVKLPKSGTSVSVEPLFKLAMNTVEPKARAVMSADLSFDEIL